MTLTNNELLALIINNDEKQKSDTSKQIKKLPRQSIDGFLLHNFKKEELENIETQQDVPEFLGISAVAEYQPELLRHVLKHASDKAIFNALFDICKKPENAELVLKIIQALPAKKIIDFISHKFEITPPISGLSVAAQLKNQEVLAALLKNVSTSTINDSLFFLIPRKENKNVILEIFSSMSPAQVENFILESPDFAIENSNRWSGLTAVARCQDAEVVDIFLNKVPAPLLIAALGLVNSFLVREHSTFLIVKNGLGDMLSFASYQTLCRLLTEVDIFSMSALLRASAANTGQNIKELLQENKKISEPQRIELAAIYKNIYKFGDNPSEVIKENPIQIQRLLKFLRNEFDNNLPKRPLLPRTIPGVFPARSEADHWVQITRQKDYEENVFKKPGVFPARSEADHLAQTTKQKEYEFEMKVYDERVEKYNKYMNKWLNVLDHAIDSMGESNEREKDQLLAYAMRIASLARDTERALQYSVKIKSPVGLDTNDNLAITELLIAHQAPGKLDKRRNLHGFFHSYHAMSHGDERAKDVINPYLRVILNEGETREMSGEGFDEKSYLAAYKKMISNLIAEAEAKVKKIFELPAEKKAILNEAFVLYAEKKAVTTSPDIRGTRMLLKDFTDISTRIEKLIATKKTEKSKKDLKKALQVVNEAFELSSEKKALIAFLHDVRFVSMQSHDIVDLNINMRNLNLIPRMNKLIAIHKTDKSKKDFTEVMKVMNEMEVMVSLQEDRKKASEPVAPSEASFSGLISDIKDKVTVFENAETIRSLSALIPSLQGLSKFPSTESFNEMYRLVKQFNEKVPVKSEELVNALKNIFVALQQIVFSTLVSLVSNMVSESAKEDNPALKNQVMILEVTLQSLAENPTSKNLDEMQWSLEKFKLGFKPETPGFKIALEMLEAGIADKKGKLLEESKQANFSPPIKGL